MSEAPAEPPCLGAERRPSSLGRISVSSVFLRPCGHAGHLQDSEEGDVAHPNEVFASPHGGLYRAAVPRCGGILAALPRRRLRKTRDATQAPPDPVPLRRRCLPALPCVGRPPSSRVISSGDTRAPPPGRERRESKQVAARAEALPSRQPYRYPREAGGSFGPCRLCARPWRCAACPDRQASAWQQIRR